MSERYKPTHLNERCVGQNHFESRGRNSREKGKEGWKGSGGSSVETLNDSPRMCLEGHRIRFKCAWNSRKVDKIQWCLALKPQTKSCRSNMQPRVRNDCISKWKRPPTLRLNMMIESLIYKRLKHSWKISWKPNFIVRWCKCSVPWLFQRKANNLTLLTVSIALLCVLPF